MVGMTEPWRALLPTISSGEPADIEERQREARIQELLDTLPPPRFSPQVRWPHHRQLLSALEDPSRAALAAVLAQATDSTDAMMVLREAASDLPPAWAREWAEAEPTSRAALLVAAASLAAEVGDVTSRDDDELDEFTRLSAESTSAWARELCERAATLDPVDPVPWIVRMHVLPLGTTPDEVLRAAQEWQSRDPRSYVGHVVLLSMLSPTRPGMDVDTLALVRDVAARTPIPDRLHALVTIALLDRFVVRARTEPTDVARAEFRDHLALLREGYARSVGAPGWRDTWVDTGIRNHFALAFYMADADDEAWRELIRLEGHVSPSPWALLDDDPLTAWQDARTWLARKLLRESPSRLVGGLV